MSALLTLGAAVPGFGAPLGLSGSTAPRPAVDAASSSASRVVESSFASAALGREMAYAVFLPPGYDANTSARYPVL